MASGMDCPPPYSDYSHLKEHQAGYPQAGYPQPGYPGPTFPQYQPASQQQQQVIVVQPQDTPAFVYRPHPVSMTGAIVLSCIVFWCFGWLFGAIAFILAMIGSDSSQNGDVSGALRLRSASYGVSVTGIVIGIIVIVIIIVFYATNVNKIHNLGTTCEYRNGEKFCY